MTHIVRHSDILARIGGDEFVIVSNITDGKQEIYPLVKRIQSQFEQEFDLGAIQTTISTSIGVAFYPDAENLDLLIKQADCAMYEAKEDAFSSTCFYSEEIAAKYTRVQKVESLLGPAIENQEFYTVFQPIVRAQGDSGVYVEALARWHSDSLGHVSPDEFITIAENTPAINGITRQITSHVRDFYHCLCEQGLQVNRITINISASQVINEHFCKRFLEWLTDFDLPHQHICLELTERQVVQNFETCKKQFALLQEQGIQIALDDFGSGFSSVTHLLALPFDVLKLDRGLISYIDRDTRNQAIIAGIVEMAHRLGMKVIAEGIEREEEKLKAIDLGCDYLQGYFFAKPLAMHETALFYELRK
jgi:EAL domain-containing protein (putative c-di-GMP-specific phosphodiesterase class I)